MKTPTRRMRKFLGLSLLFLLLLSPWWLSIFFPWSPLNCRRQDIDIHAGRIRYTRYFLFMQVSQRVEHSSITTAIDPDRIHKQPEWRRVNTFSPGVRHSPHHAFHGAFSQVELLESIWETGRFSTAARRASAHRVLELWQQSGSDNGAEAYIIALSDIAFGRERTGPDVEERDLPEPSNIQPIPPVSDSL